MQILHPWRSRKETQQFMRADVSRFEHMYPNSSPKNSTFGIYPEVKDILQKASFNCEISMSRIVNVAVMDYLTTMGWKDV